MKQLINPLEAAFLNEQKKFNRLPEPVQMLKKYLEKIIPVKCIVEDGFMEFLYSIKCPDFYEVTHFYEIFFDYNEISYVDELFYIFDGQHDCLRNVGLTLEDVKQILDGIFDDSFEMKKKYDACICKNGKATRHKFRDMARVMSDERCDKVFNRVKDIAEKRNK